MKPLNSLALAVLFALPLAFPGCSSRDTGTVSESTTAERPAEGEGADRLLPPAQGAKNPLVVVTTFEDFQCPFCRRVGPLVDRLVATFPDDVQVQYRSYPLSFHPLAPATARAAVAAGLQGKFWEMYRLLFETQRTWSRVRMDTKITAIEWAEDGLSANVTLDRGAAACVDGKCRGDSSRTCSSKGRECADLGLRRADGGSVGRWVKLIVSKVGENDSTARIYPANKATSADRLHRSVHVGNVAKISRSGRTDDKAFRAQLVRMAADMGLDADRFRKDLGASGGKGEDAGNAKITERIRQDFGRGTRSGVRGTPTIFVNGRKVVKNIDEKTPSVAIRFVREEIRRAHMLMEKGVAREDVALKLTASNLNSDKVAGWFVRDEPLSSKMLGAVFQRLNRRPKRIQKKTLEDQVAKLKLDSTPRLGAANAPFKVTVFSDFQCPYCSKIAPILHNLKDLADGKVALYFKHFPLGFHRRAKPAAVASYCAHKQGKFWDFHDAIFATPRALADADLEGHAKKLGLNLDDYRTCVSSREASVSVDDDMAEGKGASVTGTPTILVNGRKYNGGRSPEAMLDAIEKLEQGAL